MIYGLEPLFLLEKMCISKLNCVLIDIIIKIILLC